MTITHRSRFVVAVKNNEALRREFPFNKTEAVRAYLGALACHGPPRADRHLRFVPGSRGFRAPVLAGRRQAVFIDCSKSLHTTSADLDPRYIRDEIPRR
jgi:hypothetical protein